MTRRLYRPRLNDFSDHQKISGFTDMVLQRVSESVRAYVYLILSS